MLIKRFIQYLQFEKRFSPHTVTAYQKDLQQFSGFLKETELNFSNASPVHVRSWMVDLLEKGSEAKTINRKISSLRSFYKFLEREQLVPKNPALQIKAPKIPKRLPVVIEEKKLDSLLDNNIEDSKGKRVFTEDFNGLRDRLIIELLYGTGMRLAELVNLKETDIDFYEQHIKILGKRNKQRIVPVNAPLIKLLKQYSDEKIKQNFGNNSQVLIVTNEGKNAYPKLIYRIVKSCLSHISTNDKKSPHILRHTFATSLLNHGADLNAIKELLGHASLAATQVYTHNSVERLKSVYKQAHPKA